jgi:hypothetical protein
VSRLDLDLQLYNGTPTPDVQQAIAQTATYAKQLIRDRTPVETGKLRRGWRVSGTSNGLKISNATEYASFLEHGTSKMSPRHMVTDAEADIRDYFNRQLALRNRVANRRQVREEFRRNPGVNAAIAQTAKALAQLFASENFRRRLESEAEDEG